MRLELGFLAWKKRKRCWKRRKCCLTASFLFPQCFEKLPIDSKNAGLCCEGIKDSMQTNLSVFL